MSYYYLLVWGNQDNKTERHVGQPETKAPAQDTLTLDLTSDIDVVIRPWTTARLNKMELYWTIMP